MTDPDHPDPDLRGRTYAIPFDRVWGAAMRLGGGSLRGWTVLRSDDTSGVIQAEVAPRFWGRTTDVVIRVALDRDAQTRVDMTAALRGEGREWGTGRRRVRAFFRALDRALGADPGTILVATGGTGPSTGTG